MITLGEGHVFHKRYGAIENEFRYPVFYIHFSVNEEESIQKLFKNRFWKLLSLQAKDYLTGEGNSLKESIHSFLKERLSYEADEVLLQTFPRMFGYAFNPISFWFCKRKGILDAVLCEVNNTFGERHFYWIFKPEGIQDNEWFEAQKVFHVSPFMAIEGFYKFRFHVTAVESRADIYYYNNQGEAKLSTWIHGHLSSLESAYFFKLLLKYGWMTPLIVFRIHYQAMRLWLKKAQFYSKPTPPSEEISR